MSGIRKAIAKAMVNSKHTAPHVTLMDEVDVTKLVAHRKKFKEVAANKGIKLTFLPYVVKALTSAYVNSLHLIHHLMMQHKKLSINIIIISVLQQIQIKVY